jgi:hypothetical protein
MLPKQANLNKKEYTTTAENITLKPILTNRSLTLTNLN